MSFISTYSDSYQLVGGLKYVRTTRFAQISSGTSGSVALPSDAQVVLDDFGGTTDAIISGLQGGKPTFQTVKDALGNVIATTFDVAGNWVLSGTPTAYPIAIIYRVQQQHKNFDSTAADILGMTDIDDTSKEEKINKSSNVALGTSDVLYPTQNAVRTYVGNTFASPPALGNVAANTGAFTTLTASTQISAPIGVNGLILRMGHNTTGFNYSNGQLQFQRLGTAIWYVDQNTPGFAIADSAGLRFPSSTAPIVFEHSLVTLEPKSSGQLHQRKTGTPQSYYPYNVFTSESVYERAFVRWNSNVLEIGTEKAGVGTSNRPVNFIQNNRTLLGLNNGVELYNQANGVTVLESGSASNTTRNIQFPDISGRLQIERYPSGLGDNYQVQSYGQFLNGYQNFPAGDKWLQLASNSLNWINLKLVYAKVNGKPLPDLMLNQEIYLTYLDATYTDFGWGLAPTEYTDFLNGILANFDCNTRIYSKSDLKWIAADYNKVDDFYFIFEETGYFDDGNYNNVNLLQSPTYYLIRSNGPTITDVFSINLSDLFETNTNQIKWQI